MPEVPTNIAQTVVYGVAFDPKNGERVARMDLNDLFASVGRLFDLLEQRKADYLLVGGVAMLSYVEGRNTQDIDLILSSADLDRLPELRVEERNAQFAKCWLGELRVDLLFSDEEPFKNVVENYATQRRFAERDVNCTTEEGLLLMKLYALPSLYRQAQFKKVRIYEGDIADLLALPVMVSERLWESLNSVMSETDIGELRRFVAETELRLKERSSRFGGPASES